MDNDIAYLHHAIRLAQEALKVGNLPIGAIITLDGKVIAEGKNSIWVPELNPGRHAEIEAIESVPLGLWGRAGDMTLYSTLEPCLMCTSMILVHHIGRVVFGSNDSRGGASCVFGHLPPAFERLAQALEWVGPALPQVCDALDQQVFAMLEERRAALGGSTFTDLSTHGAA